jgi:Uma2 family endonuclease
MSTVEQRTYTPEDLLTMPEGKHLELVDGELVEKSMSMLGAWVAVQLIELLNEFVRTRQLGLVMSETASYQCFPDDPDRIRRPDVSFILKGRLNQEQFQFGHCRVAPDLAIEVVSPNDRYFDVEHKVGEYLSARVRIVWVFNPDRRNVRVFALDGTVRQLGENDELTGDDVLPGFRVRVGCLFPPDDLTST